MGTHIRPPTGYPQPLTREQAGQGVVEQQMPAGVEAERAEVDLDGYRRLASVRGGNHLR